MQWMVVVVVCVFFFSMRLMSKMVLYLTYLNHPFFFSIAIWMCSDFVTKFHNFFYDISTIRIVNFAFSLKQCADCVVLCLKDLKCLNVDADSTNDISYAISLCIAIYCSSHLFFFSSKSILWIATPMAAVKRILNTVLKLIRYKNRIESIVHRKLMCKVSSFSNQIKTWVCQLLLINSFI